MSDLPSDRSALDPPIPDWQARDLHLSRRRPNDTGDPGARRHLRHWAVAVLLAVSLGAGWRFWQIWGTASADAPVPTGAGQLQGPNPAASTQRAPEFGSGQGGTPAVGRTQQATEGPPEIAPGIVVPSPRPLDVRDGTPNWGANILWDRAAQPMHVLVLATDADGLRTDVVWLARIEPVTRRVSLLTIPRDTAVAVPGGGGQFPHADKIAHMHAYWDEQYTGNDRAVAAVSSLLGIQVHRYLVMDMRAFVKAVDLVGGVEIDVPVEMQYDDPYQDLNIKIPKGRQVLTGQQALHLARWRQDNTGQGYGDLGRMRMQKQVVQSLFRKAIRPGNLLRLTRAVPDLVDMMDTNLTAGEILGLAALTPKIDLNMVEWHTLPGEAPDPGKPGFGFYLTDVGRLGAAVNRWRGDTTAGSFEKEGAG